VVKFTHTNGRKMPTGDKYYVEKSRYEPKSAAFMDPIMIAIKRRMNLGPADLSVL